MSVLELTWSGPGQSQSWNSLHQLRGFRDSGKIFSNSSCFPVMFVFPVVSFAV